jgi:hypothetical protein
VELIQTNLSFEKDLEKLKGSFERDEIVDISNVEKENQDIKLFFGAILLLLNIKKINI